MAEEKRLLQASQKGDAAAFEKIVIKYQSLVCAITFSGTGRVDVSEELAQETFLRAWRNLRQLKDLGGFQAWLCAIARNLLKNYYRRKRPAVLDAAAVESLADTSPTPTEVLNRQEELSMLEQALMQIPPEYREPLVLYYRQGKSTLQVAEWLGLTESAVRTRLHRARRMLRDRIADRLEETLETTAPGKKFTKAVMLAVGTATIGLSADASAATAAGSGPTAVSGSGFATLTSTVAAKLITAAVAVIVIAGGVFIYSRYEPTAQSETASANAPAAADKSQLHTQPTLPPTEIQPVQKEQFAAVQVSERPPAETAAPPAENDTPHAVLETAPRFAETESPARSDTIQMGVYVFDDHTEQPIADAGLRVYPGCGCDCEPNQFTTDTKGCYRIDFGSRKPEYLSITASKPGYVPMMFAWRDERLETLETEFAFFLPKGEKIGGTLVNERDEPIPSASVTLFMTGNESEDYPWIRINDYTAQTDPNGRWVCDVFPAEPHSFSLKLSHPDYADSSQWVREPDGEFDEFYALRSRLVMRDGILLSGSVVDTRGKPIRGAAVFTGEDRFDENSPRTTTDADGRFEFPHFLPGWNDERIVLTVQADGFAPELEVIAMQEKIDPVTVILGPARTIRARVIDINGEPVVDAGVVADNWRGFRSLSWQSTTDANGRFAWTEAPADAVKIDIYKSNYMRINEQVFTPSSEEYVIVMHPPVVVRGCVTDAETGAPIPRFKLTAGIQGENGGIHWQTDTLSVKEFSNSRYEFTFDYPYPGHLVRIDAEGCRPAKSRPFLNTEGTVEYDFKLEKGTGLTGTVYDPNGVPADNANIYLVRENQYLHFENGVPSNQPGENDWTRSDEAGTYTFEGLLEEVPCKLLVMHDHGFTEVSRRQWKKDPNIYLLPWGRIEGTLYAGLKPEVSQGIHYYDDNDDDQDLNYNYAVNTVTDENGHFVIERALPGAGKITRRITRREGRTSYYSDTQDIAIVAGQTTVIDFGGGGRRVTGTLTKPEWAADTVDLTRVNPNLSPAVEQINPYDIYDEIQLPMPDNFDEMTVAQALEWYTQWMQSEEGRTLLKQLEEKMQQRGIDVSRHYNVMVDAGGRLEIVDVLPGTYVLSGDLRKKDVNGSIDYQAPKIAQIEHEFTVAPLTHENQDIPVDLGPLEFQPPARLALNHRVPDFKLRSPENGTVSRDDFEGSWLLMTFFMFNETAAEHMTVLRRIQVDFADDERFEMMGITMGGLPMFEKLASKYAHENSLTWKLGLIDQDSYDLVQAFKIQSWPASLLIDPEGNLLAEGLSGEALYQAVADALAP